MVGQLVRLEFVSSSTMVRESSTICVVLDLSANDLSQRWHRKCLSVECVCMCALRFDRSANAFPQWAHPNGFSPVCERRCPRSSHGREKALAQTVQRYLRSCVRTCIASAGMLT